MAIKYPENFLYHKASKIIWLSIIFYIFIFCLISYLKYRSFSYNDMDLFAIGQIFWNTIRGNFVVDAIGERTVFSGGHFFLIIFLLAPFYAVYPHPLTLLFMQSIALAVPAYFIFRLACDKIDTTFATYFALAYLLYPPLAYVNLFEFHIIAFVPLFLIPMFISFDKQRFWPFVLFMFLALSCKEDVSLVIFGLGIYALFKYARLKRPFVRRKDCKWIIVPLLSGVLWLVLVTKFIQPVFRAAELKEISGSSPISSFYAWLGHTPGEMLRNIFLHPGQTLRGMFIPAKNRYLLHLFGPLAFSSVFALKEMVIILFGLLESLLSQRSTHFSIHYQYPAMIMPFIFISAILGVRYLLQRRPFKSLRLYVLIFLFSVSLFSAFKIGPLFRLPFSQWKPDQRDALKEEFIKLIPPQTAVAATFEMATRLTHQDRLFFMYHVNIAERSAQYAYLTEQYGEKADFLLTDFLDQLTYFGFYDQNSDIYLKNFLKKYNWHVAYEINNIALWTKTKTNNGQLIETVDSLPERLPGPTSSNGYIKLAGCRFKEQIVLGHSVLHFEGYLECLREMNQRYILQLDFYGKAQKNLLYRHYFIAPDRIYPSKRWKKGEKIKISQNVLAPDSLQIENCDLILSFCLVQ